MHILTFNKSINQSCNPTWTEIYSQHLADMYIEQDCKLELRTGVVNDFFKWRFKGRELPQKFTPYAIKPIMHWGRV